MPASSFVKTTSRSHTRLHVSHPSDAFTYHNNSPTPQPNMQNSFPSNPYLAHITSMTHTTITCRFFATTSPNSPGNTYLMNNPASPGWSCSLLMRPTAPFWKSATEQTRDTAKPSPLPRSRPAWRSLGTLSNSSPTTASRKLTSYTSTEVKLRPGVSPHMRFCRACQASVPSHTSTTNFPSTSPMQSCL